MWRPGREWPTCASSPTPSAGGSSAGGWRRTCAPTWSLTPSRWPAGPAAPTSKGWWPTPTPAASSPASATANAWPNSERHHRSAASEIPSTTRWPKPSTVSTRPSSSAGPPRGPGRPSKTSSSPPWPGSTGTTPNASTAISTTSRRPSSKTPTTVPSTTTTSSLESNNPSLHQTQGGSGVLGGRGITVLGYSYDGDGLRTDLTWDTSGTLPLIVSDGIADYVTGPNGLPIERIDAAGNTSYYHPDQLGSTQALT